MTREEFKSKIAPGLPVDPGVYRFKDINGSILYVGKAKSLKNRLTSYFTGEYSSFKTKVMVQHASFIEFTIVETEDDALLLENTLIKNHQPPYNVMLKDGKTYSYICIKKEKFPRVFFTRKIIRDGSTYFGPYTSKFKANIILELIEKLFQLRTCSLDLTEKNIRAGKFKVCLQYHIKNCAGPCEGLESEESYNEKINQIKNMLKGNFGAVKTHLKQLMQEYSENLEFEKAQDIKIKLDAFDNYQSRSLVVSHTIRDVDVFSIATTEKEAFINYMKIVNGAMINAHTAVFAKNLTEDTLDILTFAIPELRDKFNSISEEIIVPFVVPLTDHTIKVTVPKLGDKKKLLDMSEKNVQFHLLQKKKDQATHSEKQTPAERILSTLQADLRLKDMPYHIECFDNSNIQGTNPVAACVVFKNARPSKKDYRHFNIKTVEGPNDFASMEEVVYRRYKRMLDENQSLPQLIIIDGGKGQLAAAVKTLKRLDIYDKVAVIGIAKRLEEIYFPEDSIPLYINKKSESLKLIQQARNEAHRFGITFHRQKRSNNFINSGLASIPGIGPKTTEKLLKEYKSLARISQVPEEELTAFVGKAIMSKLKDYFASGAEESE